MHVSVIFCLHNSLAQGKVPVELNTVLLQLVSGLLFGATHFHTPVVEATALPGALRRGVKAFAADINTQEHCMCAMCTLGQAVPCSTAHT